MAKGKRTDTDEKEFATIGATYSEDDAKAQSSDANIIYTGKRKPPLKLTDGDTVIVLPDADMQAAGFYHKDATRIIRAFPMFYKQFIKKGAKQNG